jgi:uncharacterized protein with PIN domain
MMLLICDQMLGRLARYLRMLGYDAPLARGLLRPLGPNEVFLTRRIKLVNKNQVLFIKHDRIDGQLKQAVSELGLAIDPGKWLTRCLGCNVRVQPLKREAAWGLVPDYIYHTSSGFTRCPECGKVFWPGSHAKRAGQHLHSLLNPDQVKPDQVKPDQPERA